MKCVREKEKLMLQGPSAVTLGKFNGLHRGIRNWSTGYLR